MPPTLSEHLLILAEHPFLHSERPLTQTEQLLILAEHPFLQSEQLLILAEPLLIQSECSLIQAEHSFLHAELPLKLFARRDTVIANHAFSVSSHETVISCPAFPIMVISVMINSRSAPLGTKTTIAASTRYGQHSLWACAGGDWPCGVLRGRGGLQGVHLVLLRGRGAWLGARPVLSCARSALLRGRGDWLGRRGRVSS